MEECNKFCPMCDSGKTKNIPEDSESMYMHECKECGHEWDSE